MTPDCMSGGTRYLNEVLLNSMAHLLSRNSALLPHLGCVVWSALLWTAAKAPEDSGKALS